MKKLYCGLLAVFCSTLFFASCSDDEGKNKNDDVIDGSIYGTWLLVRQYGEDEDGPYDDDYTDSTHPLYYAFYEDGTGKEEEGAYSHSFTWTCDDRDLTVISEDGYQSERYIRKLTADELVLYAEDYVDDEEWDRWCEVYVRVDKEL